jgi:hypothetical protein
VRLNAIMRRVAREQRDREGKHRASCWHRSASTPSPAKKDDVGAILQRFERRTHFRHLRRSGERAHFHAVDRRIADLHPCEPILSAPITESIIESGTIVRRIAVALLSRLRCHLAHDFLQETGRTPPCPVSHRDQGIAQLSESASRLNRTEFAMIEGCVLSLRPVAADPSNATLSWLPR